MKKPKLIIDGNKVLVRAEGDKNLTTLWRIKIHNTNEITVTNVEVGRLTIVPLGRNQVKLEAR